MLMIKFVSTRRVVSTTVRRIFTLEGGRKKVKDEMMPPALEMREQMEM